MGKYSLFMIIFLLAGYITSCNDNKPKNKVEKKVMRNLTEAEKADLERASFDELPNHNDSIEGCWLIDKSKSIKLRNNMDVDALFFLEEHKKLVMFDSSENNEFEERIGYFRFYNDELTFEITTEDEPFQYKWKTTINGEKMVAQSKKKPDKYLYLTKIDKKSNM